MNDGSVVVIFVLNLLRDLCDFSTVAASLVSTHFVLTLHIAASRVKGNDPPQIGALHMT